MRVIDNRNATVEQLRAQHLSLQTISRVECKVPQGAAAIICEPWDRKQSPSILNEAKYSLPYCMALAFLDIPITAEHFLAEHVDTRAVDFAQKISWMPMEDADFPNKFQAEICLHHIDGQRSSTRIDQVKGSAERPASVEDIQAKFMANTAGRFQSSTQSDIIDVLLNGSVDLPVATLSALLKAA